MEPPRHWPVALLVFAIETGGGDAEPPIRIDLARTRKLGVIGGHPPFQHLFREWGPIVRLVRLVADDGQLPVKPSSRKASAPRSPASEAPTMTIRPLVLRRDDIRHE